jgi:hypothetical protein
MKTNKTFAYGFLTVILALAFIACPDEKTPESNPPVANAQAEPTHTLADNLTITLDGTDSTGNISAYAWECETYTADQGTVSAEYTKAQVNALITNADTATATVKPRKAGTYTFKLTVTGNDSESDTDTVTVVVKGITHTITVPAITTIANPLNFGEVSALSGWNSDFASTDVTYTLTLDIVDQPANTTSISANGLSDGQHTITQTFYYKDNPVTNGSRSAVGFVMGNGFAAMVTEGGFPELTLLLSKGELETVNLPLNVTVSFVPLAASFPSPTINFSPSATLPTGVTYILRDDRTPQNSWNSAEVFNGQITAADYYVSLNNDVTFTQTFYFNSVEITGANSKRIVVVTAGTSATTRFVTSSSDTGSVMLKWTELP